MPTISAHRGHKCVVSGIDRNLCLSSHFGYEGRERFGRVDRAIDRHCIRHGAPACLSCAGRHTTRKRVPRAEYTRKPLSKAAEAEFLEQRQCPSLIALPPKRARPGRFPGDR